VRIGTGRFRNALLPAAGPNVRPVPSRLRQSLFSVLAPWIPGAAVLDLCAGVGALGLEALSRGASRLVLVERDRRTAGALQTWLAERDVRDASVVVGDARAGGWPSGPYDLVFLDPPFDVHEDPEGLRPFLDRAVEHLAGEGVVAVKAPARGALPTSLVWEERARRVQGDVAYVLLSRPTRDGPP
jgi:16S rRNA (guanine966-N2)-methyltransferase